MHGRVPYHAQTLTLRGSVVSGSASDNTGAPSTLSLRQLLRCSLCCISDTDVHGRMMAAYLVLGPMQPGCLHATSMSESKRQNLACGRSGCADAAPAADSLFVTRSSVLMASVSWCSSCNSSCLRCRKVRCCVVAAIVPSMSERSARPDRSYRPALFELASPGPGGAPSAVLAYTGSDLPKVAMGRRIEFQAVLARGDSECRSAAVSSCGYSDLVVSRAAAPPKKIVTAGPAAVVPQSCATQCRWCTVCDLETSVTCASAVACLHAGACARRAVTTLDRMLI